MSNQSFLVMSKERSVYPSLHERGFRVTQIVAEGEWCIPLLWFAIFRESDLQAGTIPACAADEVNSVDTVVAPIIHRRFVAKRIRIGTRVLEELFPHVSSWNMHGELLRKAIEKTAPKKPYLTMEWEQIAFLQRPQQFRRDTNWLMRLLAGERVRGARAKLKQLTNIDWKRKFPDPTSADLSDADEMNLASLLGGEHERDVPWWPPAEPLPARTRTKPKRSAATDKEQEQPLQELLAEAIEASSEARLRALLKRVDSLADKKYATLLEHAITKQMYGDFTRIPDMLMNAGVPVSQRALCSAATEQATLRQFNAMLSRPNIDVRRSSPTITSNVSAPPIFWAAYDADKGGGLRKVKLLLAAGVPVDVRDSTDTWLLELCLFKLGCARLVVPIASPKHRRAALQRVLDYHLSPRAKPSRIDEKLAQLTSFTRLLARNGMTEAEGREAEILAKRDAWEEVRLQPYPYGRTRI